MPMAVDKRTALLDAAEAVLIEHGLGGATVEQIAARAGVAKGTFYLYFKSKDEVVGALQERLWDGLLAASVDAVAQLRDDNWWEVIDAFIDTIVDYDLERRDWHRLVAQGWSGPGAAVAAREQQMIDLFAAGLQMGVDEGRFEVDDVAMTSTLLYRAVEGTMHQCCISDDPVDRDRITTAFKWLLRQVLRPAD
jgi:AcrR family transcriptional regulator